MKNRKAIRVIALAMCATLLFAGCGGSGKKSSSDNSASTAATETKDELHIAVSANPPSLDVQTSNSSLVGEIAAHVFEPLFAMDDKYEPTPVLAESYEVNDDGSVYTIKLREGVKFHNGKEMTSEDVVASMNRWIKNCSRAKALLEGSVFEAVDDYTVTLTVNKPASDILMILANPSMFAAIYPKEVVDSATEEGISEYIGTGPYKMTEWKQDQYVKLDKFEDYKNSDNATTGLAGKKEAATPTLYFDVVTDVSTRMAGVQNGQYDIAEEVPTDNYEELSNDKNLKLDVTNGGTLNLFLNTTEGIMANEDMRQAVLAVLNCEDILYASYGNEDLYELNAGWMNLSDAQWSTEAGKEYYNQNDEKKAKELLKKAGYNNEEITLVTTPDYPEMYNATLVLQEELQKIGVNAVVDSNDFNTFMEHRSDPKQFSMYITSNSYALLPVQLSALNKEWAGLDAPEVTEGIDAIRFADSTEDAKTAWENLQTFLYEDGAASVIGHYTSVNALNAKAEGYEFLRYALYWNTTVSK